MLSKGHTADSSHLRSSSKEPTLSNWKIPTGRDGDALLGPCEDWAHLGAACSHRPEDWGLSEGAAERGLDMGISSQLETSLT